MSYVLSKENEIKHYGDILNKEDYETGIEYIKYCLQNSHFSCDIEKNYIWTYILNVDSVDDIKNDYLKKLFNNIQSIFDMDVTLYKIEHIINNGSEVQGYINDSYLDDSFIFNYNLIISTKNPLVGKDCIDDSNLLELLIEESFIDAFIQEKNNFIDTCYNFDIFLINTDTPLDKELETIFEIFNEKLYPLLFEKTEMFNTDLNKILQQDERITIRIRNLFNVFMNEYFIKKINVLDSQSYLDILTSNSLFPKCFAHINNSCVGYPGYMITRKKKQYLLTDDKIVNIKFHCKLNK
jgi:hypothetical protein